MNYFASSIVNLREISNSLVIELYNFNSGGGEDEEFAGFSTGRNGYQCIFNKKIEIFIAQVAAELFKQLISPIEIDENQYRKVVKEAIVNLFTEEELLIEAEDSKENLKKIRNESDKLIKKLNSEYTHHIPAKTVRLEFIKNIKVGCVQIFSIDEWLSIVDYSDEAKDKYRGETEKNKNWKELLKRKMNKEDIELKGIALDIFRVLDGSHAVLMVNVKGYEKELSKKISSIIAKSTLDMISLFLGGDKIFYKQVLLEDRTWPNITHKLLSNGDYLGGPGSSIGKHLHPTFKNKEELESSRTELDKFLPYFEYILDGLIKNEKCIYPKLANKWIYALNWYAEGVRESNDAIAVAKLASCLDTLSHGSKIGGIKQLLRNILDKQDDDILFHDYSSQDITLHKFTKRIYEDGRSRILHGTIENLLESFQLDKERLINLARIILLECAEKLKNYTGADDDHAFKSM